MRRNVQHGAARRRPRGVLLPLFVLVVLLAVVEVLTLAMILLG